MSFKVCAITTLNNIKNSPELYEISLTQFVQNCQSEDYFKIFETFVTYSKSPRFIVHMHSKIYEKLRNILVDLSGNICEIVDILKIWSEL